MEEIKELQKRIEERIEELKEQEIKKQQLEDEERNINDKIIGHIDNKNIDSKIATINSIYEEMLLLQHSIKRTTITQSSEIKLNSDKMKRNGGDINHSLTMEAYDFIKFKYSNQFPLTGLKDIEIIEFEIITFNLREQIKLNKIYEEYESESSIKKLLINLHKKNVQIIKELKK